MSKTQVGISSVWYEGNTYNMHLLHLAEAVQKGVREAGMVGFRLNTIGVSDAISLGTRGMCYSLQSRDLIADIIKTVMAAQWYDANISIPGCDKNTYLQSTTARLEEMRVKWQDAEQWMSQCLLPESFKERIRRYEQYKWQETRTVDEEHLLRNLPTDLRRDINRHRCLALLMRVPMFAKMNERLLDIVCDHLKLALYTEGSYIVCEGDPVDEMLFIEQGKLESCTTNGGRTGFFNSVMLKAGDFCGEEFLTWALSPRPSSILPTSTRTVHALTEVKAFALKGDDLKFYGSEFRRLYSEELKHTFRYYSQQWRTWAACYIQAAWHRYKKKKLLKESPCEEVL